MSIKLLLSAALLTTCVVPASLFCAGVSFVQPQIPSGYSIIGVNTDDASNVYSLASTPAGDAVVVKTSADSAQGGWIASLPAESGYPPTFTVANDGSVYVSGTTVQAVATTAGVLQVTPPQNPSANVLPYLEKLSPEGAVVFATYICGDAACLPQAMAVDSEDNVYITGFLNPENGVFSTTTGSIGTLERNVFTIKVDPTGSKLLFAIGAGGSVITLDSAGDPYFAFEDVDVIPEVLDVTSAGTSLQHLVGVDPTGAYLGVNLYLADGSPSGIVLDSSENVYLAGTRHAAGYPIAGSAIQDAYMVLPANPQNVPVQTCFSTNPFGGGGGLQCIGLPPPPLPSVPAPSDYSAGLTGYLSVLGSASMPFSLLQSTYFGGTSSSVISSVSVGQAGGPVNLTGYVTSSDLPGLDAGSRHCVPSSFCMFLQIRSTFRRLSRLTARHRRRFS
jgi:hypothetical protein